MLHLGLLGYGEVGRAFAERAAQAPGGSVTVYLRDRERVASAPAAERIVFTDLGDMTALARPDVVMSVTTPDSAQALAEHFATAGRPGQWYLDLNSTGPSVKEAVARALDGTGVRMADGAIMGRGITIDGARVPIIIAGNRSDDLATALIGLGFNARAIGVEPGAAAAVKMARGVIVKGLEAACAESLVVARRFGVVDEVMASLKPTFENGSVRELVEMLLRTHLIHAERRLQEARMIERTVSDAGVAPIVSAGVRRLFETTSPVEQARLGSDLDALLAHYDSALDRGGSGTT
jgi:3-hydroxyisobutyrate dehydrogenase